jgi:penicillin amidase
VATRRGRDGDDRRSGRRRGRNTGGDRAEDGAWPATRTPGARPGVSWVGLTATKEALALYKHNHAETIEQLYDGLRDFGIPGQNTVCIDTEGNTLYYPAAKYPLRYTNGGEVPGNRIFDGSAGEGEWRGFIPYGQSSWDGFIPFEEIPHVRDPDYLGSANQRVVYDYEEYLGYSEYMGDPYRGTRIYQLLDRTVGQGETVDAEFMKEMQRDLYSVHAAEFVPQIVDAIDEMDGKAQSFAEQLTDWNLEMTEDSGAALIYAIWVDRYREEVFGDEFESAGLGEQYYPGEDWPLQHLDPDSQWFDYTSTERTETRADAIVRAMGETVKRIETEGYQTYGDYHKLHIDHITDSEVLTDLGYSQLSVDGSSRTLFNISEDGTSGSSWRIISTLEALPTLCYPAETGAILIRNTTVTNSSSGRAVSTNGWDSILKARERSPS